MDYLSVAQARGMGGLRLVLTENVPGPWGQAAKAVLGYRQVPYVAVAQKAFEDNEELLAWTGRRGAPLAIYNEEPPLDNWLEILMLAERLGTGNSLLPEGAIERVICLGLATEICGYWGLGWCRRISMWKLSGPANTAKRAELRRSYGYSEERAEEVPGRLRDIITALDQQLHQQQRKGLRYFAGTRPSACDFYWAAFSIMFDVPKDLDGRIPEYQRAMYQTAEPVVMEALTSRLLQHRDMIYEEYIGLPITF